MSFHIDIYDGNSLLLVPGWYPTTEEMQAELVKFQGFPERKWKNNNSVKGWVVPLTAPNIAYLRENWFEQDYKVLPSAKILMLELKLTLKVDELKAEKRWEYLFNKTVPSFDYPYVLKPFDHQKVTVEAARGAEYFGLLMEMGTGKTKCAIDELMLYALELKENEILKIVVACPKSLIKNWEREFHKNFPDMIDYDIAALNKGMIKAVEAITELLSSRSNVKIILVSQDSCDTLQRFIKLFKPTILIVDESHYLKNPGTDRWKAIRGIAEHSAMRRILTGTPISNNIMDVWAQFEILRPGILGYSTYNAFKQRFAEYNDFNGHETVTGHRKDTIDELKQAMAKCSFVVKKSECLDLPPKMYDVVKVPMGDKMREIYEAFSKDFFVQLESGSEVSTEIIIVQMLKLAQICSGYAVAIKKVQNDEDLESEPLSVRSLEFIPEGDAKMEIMLDRAEDVMREGKLIIWSRFKLDNETILRRLGERVKSKGWYGGKYDSTVNDEMREHYKCAFGDRAEHGPTKGDDNFRFIVGSPKAGGVGLTLLGTRNVPCKNAFYYASDFNFGARDQSEDRSHRIGLINPMLYTDFVYEDSIEEYILSKLKKKRDLATDVKNVGEIKEFLLKGSKVLT